MRTESRENLFGPEDQLQNMRKVAYVKLDNTIKRHHKEWQDLVEMFANYNKSSSKDQLKQNQINFINKLNLCWNKTRILIIMTKKEGSNYFNCSSLNFVYQSALKLIYILLIYLWILQQWYLLRKFLQNFYKCNCTLTDALIVYVQACT